MISFFRNSKKNRKYLDYIPGTTEFRLRETEIKLRENEKKLEDMNREECPVRYFWIFKVFVKNITQAPPYFLMARTVETKDMNKEKDFVYLVTLVRSTPLCLAGCTWAVLQWKIKVTRSKSKFLSLFISLVETGWTELISFSLVTEICLSSNTNVEFVTSCWYEEHS